MEYKQFLEGKKKKAQKSGFTPDSLNKKLFPFQCHIVTKALEAGKYAIFADCVLGKTLMQLSWAEQVAKQTGGKVLIAAPLAVVRQTLSEAAKFGIEAGSVGSGFSVEVTNYDQLKKIDASKYTGIVLDESSILKNFQGQFRNLIIESFKNTPYKLACTATPAPNDPAELGNHCEFLDVMSRDEMIAMFFINDVLKTGEWRLKKHAVKHFYSWVSSWASMVASPSDIGFSDDGYNLPNLEIIDHEIKTPKQDNGLLFNDAAVSATGFNSALRDTAHQRMSLAAELANSTSEQVIVWIKHDKEGVELKKLIPDAIEVTGKDKKEEKQSALLSFAKGEYRVLITKPKIAQFGLNFQNCHIQVIASLDFSFEGLYQCIRRSWRFGQLNEVVVHIICTDTMGNVRKSIEKKQKQFSTMQKQMALAVSNSAQPKTENTKRQDFKGERFEVRHGDSIQLMKEIPDNSIDFSFFSPPFSSLYTYSDDEKDLSNCTSHEQFYTHFRFMADELLRIIKTGRIVAMHVTQLTTGIGKDGFLSIINFRGDMIKIMQEAGFDFHMEATIRKNPQLAAVRTKNIQLLHGTTKKDALTVRPGLADYIIGFKKRGVNAEPVNYEKNGIPFDVWCDIAEPVWMDIEEGEVLKNYRKAKDNEDERHITPTQLKPIKNLLMMYTNPNDLVFSPCMGMGSEGYQALMQDRRFLGIELKGSYFDLACENLLVAESLSRQTTLF